MARDWGDRVGEYVDSPRMTRRICDAMVSRAVKLAIRDGGMDPQLFE